MTTPPASGADDAFLAAFRAGYEHGYDIGRAHGRAEVFIEHAPVPELRMSGPTRAELLERGYVPRDTSRPPALPAHLWSVEDWANADERDLPTTDHGRAEWRTAVAAGRVPAHLAEAFAAREGGRSAGREPDRPETGPFDMPQERRAAAHADRPAPASTSSVRATVADTGRRIDALRGQIEAVDRGWHRTVEMHRQVAEDVAEIDQPTLDWTGRR